MAALAKEFDTQVGSPAVRLRLARCTAWVKRWSKAMDFFQTIFKTNISLSGISRLSNIQRYQYQEIRNAKNSRNIPRIFRAP